MLGLNNTGTGTGPTDTTGIIQGCEGNLLVENSGVGVVAVFYLYDVIRDGNVFSVTTDDGVLIGQTGFDVIGRSNAIIHVVLADSRFRTR